METFHRLIFPSNKKIGQKEPSLLSENEGDGVPFFLMLPSLLAAFYLCRQKNTLL